MKSIAKTFIVLIFIFSAILGFKTIVRNPVFPDSWLHIRTGRYIISHYHIPSHKDISLKETQPSLQYVNHTWLADAIFATTASYSIMVTVYVILLPLFIFSITLLYISLRANNISREVIFVTLSAFIILLTPFWKIHPFVFCVPLVLLLSYSFSQWKSGKSKYIWFITVIIVAWANLWGGFVILPILYSLASLITYSLHKPKPNRSTAAFALLLGIAGSLLNPIGIRIWIYLLTENALLISKKLSSTLTGALLITNQNFTKNSNPAVSFSLYLAFSLFCVVLFIVFSARVKGFFKKNSYLLSATVFFALSLMWIRFIPVAIASGAIVFGQTTETLIQILKRFKRGLILGFILLLAMVYVMLIVWIISGVFDVSYPSPFRASGLITKYNLPDRILTSFDITPYISYQLEQRKLLIDAQDDMLDENEIINFYATANVINEKAFNGIIDQNHINTALVTRDSGNWAFNIAARKKTWSLIYFDNEGYLFVKKDSMDKKFIDSLSFKYIDLTRSLGFDPNESTASAKELERFLKQYPDNTLARGQLATIYRIQNHSAKAEELLSQVPLDQWDYAMYTEMGRIKASEGLCVDAEKNFLKALDLRKEQNYSRTILDLGVLYAVCFNDKTKAKHYFQRYNSFLLGGDEQEKLRKLSQEFGIQLDE